MLPLFLANSSRSTRSLLLELMYNPKPRVTWFLGKRPIDL